MTFKQTFLANFLALLAAMGVGGAISIPLEIAKNAIAAAATKEAIQQANQFTTEPFHLNP